MELAAKHFFFGGVAEIHFFTDLACGAAPLSRLCFSVPNRQCYARVVTTVFPPECQSKIGSFVRAYYSNQTEKSRARLPPPDLPLVRGRGRPAAFPNQPERLTASE